MTNILENTENDYSYPSKSLRSLWRKMQYDDLEIANLLSEELHPNNPEEDIIFNEIFRLFPEGCWTLLERNIVRGYCISHPWNDNLPPTLNSLLHEIPEKANTLFIQDLGIHPQSQHQHKGITGIVIGMAKVLARSYNLPSITGVAVNNTLPLWLSMGAQVIESQEINTHLEKYYAPEAKMVKFSL